jgi:hypothetical protein
MRKFVALAFVVAAIVVVPTALAGGSTALDGYGSSAAKPVVQVKGTTGSSSPSSSQATGGETLPFTGSDLAVFVGAGAVLVGLGFGLRRLGRNKA